MSLRHGGVLRDPADAGKEPLALAGWLFPGGGAARPPVVDDPFWRSGAGRHTLAEVIAGQSDELRAQLLAAYATAIGEIVGTAAAQKAAGGESWQLVAAGRRMLRELIGQAQMTALPATVGRVLRFAVVTVVAVALAGCGLAGSDAAAGSAKGVRVIEVTDGDTIDVAIGGREEAIRLIGIDTPEVYFGEECGAAAASLSMKRMLEPGDRVRLVRDRTQDNRDSYDRLLRYVELGRRDVGRVQVRRGHAAVYVFDEPFRRLGSYERAERRAEARGAGVWGACGGDFHLPL